MCNRVGCFQKYDLHCKSHKGNKIISAITVRFLPEPAQCHITGQSGNPPACVGGYNVTFNEEPVW